MAVIVDVSIDLNPFLDLLLSVIPCFLPSNGLVSLLCVCGSVAETLVLQPRKSVGRISYSGKDSFRREFLPKKFAWIFKNKRTNPNDIDIAKKREAKFFFQYLVPCQI